MDRRERSHHWYSRFDESRMVLILEEHTQEDGEIVDLEIPARFEVCETCNGKGSHVNPSIDSHGLSREDFDEDPDFAESYFAGDYDVPCNECDGRRVVPVVDESRASKEAIAAAISKQEDDAEYAALCAAERRAGA
jgi:RecJ-like exonuclease